MVYSLLRDNKSVQTKAEKYPVIVVPQENALLVPEKFDGRDSWNLYIRPPSNTKTTPSFAIVAKDVINDRFTLQSGAQIEFDLDHYQLLACKDKAPVVNDDGPSSNFLKNAAKLNAVMGYSVYDAWEFIYTHGLCQQNCFSLERLKELNYETVDNLSYEQKIKLYGFQCEILDGKEDTQCLTKINDTPIAKRIFLSSSIYNVTSNTMSMSEKIAAIKYDIVKWGPVAAGFLMYENFAKWNGQNVYSKTEGAILGGHYVSIIGWKDDYWICRNSWGANWGLMGYCKIKIGLESIQLEDNVSASMPQFFEKQPSFASGMWNSQTVPIENMSSFNPELYQERTNLKVDYALFYKQSTIDLIRQGKLAGQLTPLIPNTSLLPNFLKFWVMDIQNFNFVAMDESTSKQTYNVISSDAVNTVLIWVIVVTAIAIFVFLYNNKNES